MGDTGLPIRVASGSGVPIDAPLPDSQTQDKAKGSNDLGEDPPSRSRSFYVRSQSYLIPEADVLPPVTDPDEQRRLLGEGLQLYQEGHPEQAKLKLARILDNPLASELLRNIKASEREVLGKQIATILKTVAQDQRSKGEISEAQKDHIFTAIDLFEQTYSQETKTKLSTVLKEVEGKLDQTLRFDWLLFSNTHQELIASLDSAFQDPSASMRAHSLLLIALTLRESQSSGAAWWTAHLALDDPASHDQAKQLIDHIEGKKFSTEFIVSDLFDQGGTSMLTNLLALVPTIGLTRKLYRMRPLYAYMAGGLVHWAATKSLLLATGFTGEIAPHSMKDFAGELGSSYLQSTTAIFLSNRWFWKNVPKLATAEVEESTVLGAKTIPQKLLGVGGSALRGLWFSSKLSMKLGVLSAVDLGSQYLGHTTHMQAMSQPGLPSYLMPLFSQTRKTRQEVFQTYGVRRLLEPIWGKGPILAIQAPSLSSLDFDMNVLLNHWQPRMEEAKSQVVSAILTEAATRGDLALNIRRWITAKVGKGDFKGANATLERQKIPLRFDKDGSLCVEASKEYGCKE